MQSGFTLIAEIYINRIGRNVGQIRFFIQFCILSRNDSGLGSKKRIGKKIRKK